jgi:hypothetical protein
VFRTGSLAIALAALLATVSAARAAVYEKSLVIEDEEDLLSLEQSGDLSPDAADTLLELLREGVDLNTASRDELYDLPGLTYPDVDKLLAYREAQGRIEDPAALVSSGTLSAAQLLQIAPFLRVAAAGVTLPVSGNLRGLGAFASADDVPPPALLAARLRGPAGLSAGALLATTRRSVAPPRYDALLDTLVTSGPGFRVNLPRAFLEWTPRRWRLIAGTFTLGFGERLTLDNTRRFTPHGLYLSDDFRRPPDLSRVCQLSSPDPLGGACADGAPNRYVTPDFATRDTVRGLAGSVEEVALGATARLSAYGFVSFQSKALYQYELYDRRFCGDPRDNASADCAAPPIYLDTPSRVGSARVVFSTLPALYDELAAGGHVELRPTPRYRIGLTGYGAKPYFHAVPMQLDFQEYSRTPWGGSYGAVGVDAQASFANINLAIEAAHSFDAATGGGIGVVQRTTWSPAQHELELSLRYYDDRFANPYARPVSAPDEYDGQRARNELGGRLRWLYRPSADWEFKSRADFWVLPFTNERVGPAGTANLYGQARADFQGWEVFAPSAWVDARNRNLASSEHGRCASGTAVYTEGSPFTCSGDTYRLVGRVELRPLGPRHTLAVQGSFSWTDDARYQDRFRNDAMLWAELRSQVLAWLHLRMKSRWLVQDLSDDAALERSLWTFLEAQLQLPARLVVALRYDVLLWLDRRASTLTRVPNPEHRWLADVRWQF